MEQTYLPWWCNWMAIEEGKQDEINKRSWLLVRLRVEFKVWVKSKLNHEPGHKTKLAAKTLNYNLQFNYPINKPAFSFYI